MDRMPENEEMTAGFAGLSLRFRKMGESVERAVWGGSVGSMERRAKHATRISRHRREVWELRQRQHHRRMQVFLPLAMVGVALAGVWLSTPYPVEQWWLGVVAVAMILPLLVEVTR